MSEAAYLAEQAAEARAAMGNALCDLTRNGAVVLSPRRWVKEHPWATLVPPALGLGTIGAVLSFLLLRKKKQHRGGLLSRLFSRQHEPAPKPVQKKAWWWLIVEQAFSLAQPALFSLVASVVSSRFANHNDGQTRNGG